MYLSSQNAEPAIYVRFPVGVISLLLALLLALEESVTPLILSTIYFKSIITFSILQLFLSKQPLALSCPAHYPYLSYLSHLKETTYHYLYRIWFLYGEQILEILCLT